MNVLLSFNMYELNGALFLNTATICVIIALLPETEGLLPPSQQ